MADKYLYAAMGFGVGCLFMIGVHYWNDKHYQAEQQEALAKLPEIPVPGSLIKDYIAMPDGERPAFLTGYFSTIAFFKIGAYGCAVPYFKSEAGDVKIDMALKATATHEDIKDAPPADFYQQKPVPELIAMTMVGACNKKPWG